MMENYKVIGKRVEGADEKEKAKGTVVYADDFTLPGMLYGKVFRSTIPFGKIKKLDISKALALEGVETIITAADVPNNESVSNVVGQTTEVGLLEAKHQVLARNIVRYYGEPIALIAAKTYEIACDAAELIKVEYEEMEGVFDPVEAMKPEAPKIHGDNNIIARWKVRQGNVKDAFKNCDVVVENRYKTQFQEHAHIEPESGVAWIDENGVINLRVSTQVIEQYRDVAHVLGVPESKVRIIGTIIGGGFGGKEDITVEVFLGLLVWKTGKPVKLTYTREEMGYGRHKRHPYVMRYKHGATKDGKIVAMEAEIISDSGAYVYLSPWVLLYSTVHATGPYMIPNVKVDAYSVLTNNIYTSAFRSFGAIQVTYAVESQMNELAKALNMNPLDLRKKNFLKRGDVTASGQKIDSYVALGELADKALEALGPKKSSIPPYRIGRGVACSWQSYGRMTYLHDTASVWVGLELDGSVEVRSGIPDLGGGQRESLRQIAAEILGVPLDDVIVYSTDSKLTPLTGTVTATRALYMSGNAVKMASNQIRNTLLEKAAEIMHESKDSLDIIDKTIVSSMTKKKIPMRDIIKVCASEGIPLQTLSTFKAPFTKPIDGEIIKDNVFVDFTFSVQACDVSVDEETGKVNVIRLAAAHDVGKSINLNRVEGQIEGGAVQGIGYALMESYIEEKGIPKTNTLAEYLIPTSKDIPEIIPIVMESGTGKGPFGAKGIGEPSITATAPAITNAIYDAAGVRIKELPATPERVYFALKNR